MEEWIQLMKSYRAQALIKVHDAKEEFDVRYWNKVAHELDDEIKK